MDMNHNLIRILRFVFKDDGVAGRMAHWLPNGYSRLLGTYGRNGVHGLV